MCIEIQKCHICDLYVRLCVFIRSNKLGVLNFSKISSAQFSRGTLKYHLLLCDPKFEYRTKEEMNSHILCDIFFPQNRYYLFECYSMVPCIHNNNHKHAEGWGKVERKKFKHIRKNMLARTQRTCVKSIQGMRMGYIQIYIINFI